MTVTEILFLHRLLRQRLLDSVLSVCLIVAVLLRAPVKERRIDAFRAL
ncbi:unnamed protein product [Ophioblennius macclurei]